MPGRLRSRQGWLPPPGSRSSGGPTRPLGPGAHALPPAAPRAARVAMAIGNACQARRVPAPPCRFSETESLLLVPQHVGEILLPLGASRGPNSKTRLGRLSIRESAGEPSLFPCRAREPQTKESAAFQRSSLQSATCHS